MGESTDRIYYTKPSITDLEVEYATDAAKNGWGAECYGYIERFEREFADYLGVRHAIATSSCTGAIHMGLAALRIGPGDEVILADINWIASAAPITYLGATPVLVDILEDTWCLDPERVEEAITEKTKAIIAVHIYGNLCDMPRLLEIGKRHGIPVIEDSAEAIGSSIGGKKAGSMGAFGTFSFHGTKTMTTGEGGMWVSNDDDLAEEVRTLSNHGRRAGETRQFWPNEIGFKYKMSNVAAAIGCAQLERIEELVGKKREVFSIYKTMVSDLPLSMNREKGGEQSGYWMPTIVVDDEVDFCRESLLGEFSAESIDGRVFFWPLSQTRHFENRFTTPVSQRISPRGVNLPSHHELTIEDQQKVVAVVRKVV